MSPIGGAGGPGGVGGPKGPGGPEGPGDLDDVADVGTESNVSSTTAAKAAGGLEAMASEIAAGKLTPREAVDKIVDEKGTRKQAEAYLNYLYSEEGQVIAAKHALRPRSATVLKKYASVFKPVQLFTVKEYFGSLTEAQKVHFNDGGQFDKIYTVK